jgi:hypothetical protein
MANTWDRVSVEKAQGGWIVVAARENKSPKPGEMPWEEELRVVTDRTKLQPTIDELLGTDDGTKGGRR